MRFSGVVSARNHQDLVDFLAGPGRLKKRAWAASLLLIGCGFFVAVSALTFLWFLGDLLRRDDSATVLAQPHLVALILLGMLMMLLTVVWLRGLGRLWSRFRSLPRDAEVVREALRQGVNVGEMTFEADEQGLVVSSGLARSSFTWSAFRQLAESNETLFLIIDPGAAVILPKAALGGESALDAFKALAEPRIGAAR